MPYSGLSGGTAPRNGQEREPRMENDTTEQNTDLVTESLVEEVSIDGMCGVY